MSVNYSFEEITLKQEKRWNELLFNAENSFFTGGITFNNVQRLNLSKVTTIIMHLDGQDIAGAHYTLKSSAGGFIKSADILSGIFFREKQPADWFRAFLQHFMKWAKQNNASYCRISQAIPQNRENNSPDFKSIFIENGFNAILTGSQTYWIDLSLSEEELLKKMNSQTRRKIKKAENAGIDVESIDYFSPDKVLVFYELYSGLGDRKKFNTLSKERFFAEVKSLFDTGATLFFLKYQGVIINVALATSFGRASYYHGALNPEYKKLPDCPSPGHFMQWTMIRYMKAKGLKTYDMAFCPGPVPIEGHPQFDMWRFKYGFGGDHIQFMPTYGKILKPLRGRLFQFLRYKK